MISASLLLAIMLFHWFADFYCQTDEMAKGKSMSNYWLGYHVAVYTGLMALCTFFLFGLTTHMLVLSWLGWVAFNGIAHLVTDYFTSRWSSEYFKVGDYHNGFIVVGIDQWIHLACLTLSTAYFV